MVAIGVGVGVVVLLGVWGAFIVSVKTVERPKYRLVDADGAIEVRDYPPLVVAEVTTEGGRWEAVNRGFGPLASYIFARSRSGEKIAMTAPVTQTPAETIARTAPVTQTRSAVGAWKVRFVMPAKYTLESLPAPGPGVQLERLPARRVAAIRFAGRATDADLAAREAELRRWMEARDLTPAGPATYAYYDDPWMPAPLRRNEVLVPVS